MTPASLAIDKASLPRSVRGIDQAHLRRAIRRKQNSESARRCRARRRQERLLASVSASTSTATNSSGPSSPVQMPVQMPSAPSTPPVPPQHRILQLEQLVRTLSHQLALAQAQCATLLTMRDPTSVQAPITAHAQIVSPVKNELLPVGSDVQEREEFLATIDQLAEL